MQTLRPTLGYKSTILIALTKIYFRKNMMMAPTLFNHVNEFHSEDFTLLMNMCWKTDANM